MTFRKLYIIGNGFDLWHHIPSSLDHFKEYVLDTDRGVYRAVREYLPTQDNWSDLERSLAGIDVDLLIDNFSPLASSYGADDWSDSAHHDFQYEVRNTVNRLSEDLRKAFSDWIRSLPIPTPETAPVQLTSLDTEAVFFNFNYTRTMGSLYGVPDQQILYIHGCADRANDALVLGHAWNPQSREPLNKHLTIEDLEEVEDIDPRLLEVHQIIDRYFSTTFKRSAELIAQNQDFFTALTNIKEVVVLGHSLDEVDATYFTALLAQPSVAQATWFVACRSPEDWPQKQARLKSLGIDLTKALPIGWETV